MDLSFERANREDIPRIFQLSKELIDAYEDIAHIDYEKVLAWVHKKLEQQIDSYERILLGGCHAGYVHFLPNGAYMELDDLYLFPKYQNKGIGTEVINRCIRQSDRPVMLYVFIRNQGAVRLYKRLGFRITETLQNSRYIMLREK